MRTESRTEDDLRAALATLERETPDARDVLARLDSPVRRRATRPRILIATTAATALAVAAVPALRALTAPDAAPQAQPFRWEYSYQVDLPSGWTLGYRDVHTKSGHQVMLNTPAGGRCDITIFGPGAFDTGRISPDRTPVTINGHQGYVATISGLMFVVTFDDKGNPQPRDTRKTALAWEYAAGSWAVSDCDPVGIKPPASQIVDDERTSAAAIRMTPQALRMPYRIGYLPDGWEGRHLAAEGPQLAGAPQPDLWLDLTPRDAPDDGQATPGNDELSGPPTSRGKQVLSDHLSILFTKGTSALPAEAEPTTINGRSAWLIGSAKNKPNAIDEVVIRWSGYELRVQGPAEYDLERIARELQLAPNPADESTWFDGTVAIP